jgi:bla regulator protein BlaR1
MKNRRAGSLNSSNQLLLAAAGVAAVAGLAVFGLLNPLRVRAQDQPRAIEAASIRPASFPSEDYFRGWTLNGGICEVGARAVAISGNRLNMPKMTLCQLIVMGYNVQGFRIVGAPAWMLKVEQPNYYDVQIKAEGEQALTEDQARGLMKDLVADRFRVTLHRDTKTLPVYELAIAKNGTKVKETPVEGRPQRNGVPMKTFLFQAADFVDRPIVDKTGLTGTHYQYQWDAKALREELKEGIKPVPSIFHEVEEQLGLTLKPANDPIEVLVIDRAEKPSEN